MFNCPLTEIGHGNSHYAPTNGESRDDVAAICWVNVPYPVIHTYIYSHNDHLSTAGTPKNKSYAIYTWSFAGAKWGKPYLKYHLGRLIQRMAEGCQRIDFKKEGKKKGTESNSRDRLQIHMCTWLYLLHCFTKSSQAAKLALQGLVWLVKLPKVNLLPPRSAHLLVSTKLWKKRPWIPKRRGAQSEMKNQLLFIIEIYFSR